MDPEDNEGLDNELDGDATQDGDEGSDNSAPPNQTAGGDEASSKRINDLMSKWQSSEAEANRLKAELAKLQGQPAPKPEAAGGSGQDSQEFLDFAREDARRRLFESDPKLAAAGLDPSSIAGTTLAEMKASLKVQQTLVSGIESRARAAVLREHGLDPEVVAGGHEPVEKIESMSEEEFAKFLSQRDAARFK